MSLVMAGRDALRRACAIADSHSESTHAEVRQMLEERIGYQASTAARARRLFLTSGIICSILIIIAGWQFSLDLGTREIFGRARAVKNERFRQAVELATDNSCRSSMTKGRYLLESGRSATAPLLP